MLLAMHQACSSCSRKNILTNIFPLRWSHIQPLFAYHSIQHAFHALNDTEPKLLAFDTCMQYIQALLMEINTTFKIMNVEHGNSELYIFTPHKHFSVHCIHSNCFLQEGGKSVYTFSPFISITLFFIEAIHIYHPISLPVRIISGPVDIRIFK